MSGFLATSGKYEVFAPGSDTYVMFNDSQDLNAVSTLTYTKGTETLQTKVFKTNTDASSTAGATSAVFAGDGNDIGMFHDGTNSYVRSVTGELNIVSASPGTDINIDADGDDVVIKYSGATGATFSGTGLNLASGDAYQVNGTSVVDVNGAIKLAPALATSTLSALSSDDAGADKLVIYDNSAGAWKSITPTALGVGSGSGGGGSDALARALKTLDLVEIDAS